MKSVKRTRLTMSLNYLRCTKKQPDWMKLLSFPDVVIEKHSTKQYEELHEYLERLKSYAYHIETCGEERNSYSKTDHDATFMRLKRDYMGNDQLLPAYNLQAAICDEYIAVIDVKPYASDMECFVPLMEKFNRTYGHYPKYPVADAGYGSYNNYLYCEEHGMEKYMKFTMYKKKRRTKSIMRIRIVL